jgi:hypothetical protein
MVEQDLVISRALVEIYAVPALAERLAFRGGTALYKLHLRPAAPYSEDPARADRRHARPAAQRARPMARHAAAQAQRGPRPT